jgi:hypothetical protein
MTYKAFFEVSEFTVIEDTFMDNEYWIEFEADSFRVAEVESFTYFVQKYMFGREGGIPVMRKIELMKIEEKDGEVKIFKNPFDE